MNAARRTLVVIVSGTFLVTFDGGAVQMALPMLRRDLGVRVGDVQWVMTAYLLASTIALLPAGRIGDAFGRARVWRAGLALFTVASAVATFMPGIWTLVAARSLQGFGAALVAAQAAALLADAYPDARGFALGVGNLAIALGLITGPPLGALLTRAVSWRLVFPPAVLIGTLALLGSRRHLPRSEPTRERLDVAGGALLALALAGLLIGATDGRRWGASSPATLATLAASAALVGAFVVRELHADDPLLRLAMFRRNRWFLSGTLTALSGYAALFTLTLAMPFFLVNAQGRNLVGAGLVAGIVPVGLSIGAPLAGWGSDRRGSRLPCAVGLALVAAALLVVAGAGHGAGLAVLLPALGVAGLGFGGFEAPNLSAALGSIPEEEMGLGTATVGVARNLGMTLGTAAAATLLDWRIESAAGTLAARAASGVRYALIAGAGAAVLGIAAALLRPSGKPTADDARR